MSKPKYQRCGRCKELVIDASNCANCANRNPLSLTGWVDSGRDRKPRITLDQIEGNSEEYDGGIAFKKKAFRA